LCYVLWHSEALRSMKSEIDRLRDDFNLHQQTLPSAARTNSVNIPRQTFGSPLKGECSSVSFLHTLKSLSCCTTQSILSNQLECRLLSPLVVVSLGYHVLLTYSYLSTPSRISFAFSSQSSG